MDDERIGSGDASSAEEPIVDWLDTIAEAEGLSRMETLEYLISSYWQLNEVFQLLQESEQRFDPDTEPTWPSPDEPDAGRGEPVDATSRASPPGESDGAEDATERLPAHLGDLQNDVDELAVHVDELEAVVEGLDARAVDERSMGELAQTVDDLVERASALEAEVEGVDESVEDLTERYERLLQTKVSSRQFSAFERDTLSFQDAIERRHESLRDHVGTEFGHLRTILTALIERADTTDDRLDDLRRQETALDALVDHRERMIDLAEAASRRGIVRADCGYCGHTVDLGLLASPSCPKCDRPFDRIEEESRLFGFSTAYRLEIDRTADSDASNERS